jgi:hypothetical protein
MKQCSHRRQLSLGNWSCRLLVVSSITLQPSAAGLLAADEIKTQHVSEAGPDYHIQGEYVGSLEVDGVPEMIGLHVVARGDGTFEAWGYHGGLPGAGWDGSKKIRLEGQTEGKRTILRPEGDSAGSSHLIIRNGRARVRNDDDKVIGRLERVIRKSPTLGAKPPEHAVVIFDGTSTDALRVWDKEEKPGMTPEGFLQLLPGSDGIETREAFGACKLHIEFRLPFEPKGRGQGRGNSGCYLQGRYEVQILDSFGLEGEQHECGGVYSTKVNPRVNMCFPPLSWQTYDIEFSPAVFDGEGEKKSHATLTVHHNGVEVYRDLQVRSAFTTAAKRKTETNGPHGHYLQDHGHELWYRNIWLIKR